MKNLSVENFNNPDGNDCYTPCLVDELSPYHPTQIYIQTGRNFKSLIPEKTTMEDNEDFQNKEHFAQGDEYEKVLSQLTPYKIEECYINVYLPSNFNCKFENNDKSFNVYPTGISCESVNWNTTN